MHRFLTLASLTAVVACTSGYNLTGTWTASFPFPGSSLALTIQQVGTAITGTGAYQAEAGPAGTLQVAGAYDAPAVRLTLKYDDGATVFYIGTVDGFSQISGTLGDSLGQGISVPLTRR